MNNTDTNSKATTMNTKENIVVAVDTNNWSINYNRRQQIIKLQLEHTIELQQKQLELQKHQIFRLQIEQEQRLRQRMMREERERERILISPEPPNKEATNKKKITMNNMISPDTNTCRSSSSIMSPLSMPNPLYNDDIKSIVSPPTNGGNRHRHYRRCQVNDEDEDNYYDLFF
jgi:hypothetical protein